MLKRPFPNIITNSKNLVQLIFKTNQPKINQIQRHQILVPGEAKPFLNLVRSRVGNRRPCAATPLLTTSVK